MSKMLKNTYLSSPLTVKKFQDEGRFCGYASLFEKIDSQGDRVRQGAFEAGLKKNAVPKMLWQHNVTEPIGQWNLIREDQKGLYVEGQLLLDLQKGREVYSLLKKGILDGLSIGCTVKQAQYCEKDGTRDLQEIDLLEISLVTFPANSEAKVTSVKSCTRPSPHCFTPLIWEIQRTIELLKS